MKFFDFFSCAEPTSILNLIFLFIFEYVSCVIFTVLETRCTIDIATGDAVKKLWLDRGETDVTEGMLDRERKREIERERERERDKERDTHTYTHRERERER